MKVLKSNLWSILFSLCALCLLPACSDDDDEPNPGKLPAEVQKYMAYPEGLSDDGKTVVQKITMDIDEGYASAPIKRINATAKRAGTKVTTVLRWHFASASGNAELNSAEGFLICPNETYAQMLKEILKEEGGNSAGSSDFLMENLRNNGRCIYFDIVIPQELDGISKEQFIEVNGGLAEDPDAPNDSTDIDDPFIPGDSTDIDDPFIPEDSTSTGQLPQINVPGLTHPAEFVGEWITTYYSDEFWNGQEMETYTDNGGDLHITLMANGTAISQEYDEDYGWLSVKTTWGYKDGYIYTADPSSPQGYERAEITARGNNTFETTSIEYNEGHKETCVQRFARQ